MVNSTVHLPDGQHFTVVPVFAGLLFKSHELNPHHSPYPVGWTIVLHTEDGEADGKHTDSLSASSGTGVHPFRRPTLQGDSLFLSSVSNPSSTEFKPAASPTRMAAMMLWVSLYWYFQQPAPDVLLPPTAHSSGTPVDGRPRGEWRIRIKRDGMLRVRNLIPKLERMGLIATLESSVVCASTTAAGAASGASGGGEASHPAFGDDDGWDHMYVSRSMFWQIPPQLFLFSLQPVKNGHGHGHGRGLSGSTPSSFPGSPTASRPASPGLFEHDAKKETLAAARTGIDEATEAADYNNNNNNNNLSLSTVATNIAVPVTAVHPPMLASVQSFPMGPFYSTSHLPTYYPPSPLRYTMTGNVRHPARPRPPRMGEVFYNRYIPSVQQYLSFRVASLSPRPVPYYGPKAAPAQPSSSLSSSSSPPAARAAYLATLPDTALLETWMAIPRVHKFWGDYTPDFLRTALASRHSFPVIGLWDGVPFGYFELYWVKEDTLGLLIGAQADDFDRGLHVFVGEEWARGRVPLWLTSIVQWAFASDYRTMSVCIEPRVDNQRFIEHLQRAGFNKQREITFQHKQSWFGRLQRDGWEGPAL